MWCLSANVSLCNTDSGLGVQLLTQLMLFLRTNLQGPPEAVCFCPAGPTGPCTVWPQRCVSSAVSICHSREILITLVFRENILLVHPIDIMCVWIIGWEVTGTTDAFVRHGALNRTPDQICFSHGPVKRQKPHL